MYSWEQGGATARLGQDLPKAQGYRNQGEGTLETSQTSALCPQPKPQPQHLSLPFFQVEFRVGNMDPISRWGLET